MVKCLGIKRVDFTNDNGVVIQGYNFWFEDTVPSSAGWVGSEVYKKFLNDDAVASHGWKLEELVGHQVEVVYGRKDKIESITVIK